MSILSPMAMSQTKDELLKHLDLPLEVYNRMAKETDQVYKWLISEKSHLKKNCEKRSPPYDWSDVKEKSKDEAMELIAKSSDEQTRFYWSMAQPTFDCPNWIARWFLYHKFRYRDMRSRNTSGRPEAKSDHNRHAHRGGEHGREYKQEYGEDDTGADYHRIGESMYTSTSYHQHHSDSMSSGMHHYNYGTNSTIPLSYETYTTNQDYTTSNTADPTMASGAQSKNQYWDPVRDACAKS